jgi:ubiquinone/menaquinone biosynthesis C-methylase UbiE
VSVEGLRTVLWGVKRRLRALDDVDAEMIRYYAARADEYDGWYLRSGRYSHGPDSDAAWRSELEAAGRWLDGLEAHGEVVELAAGTGWWSPWLARKGALSLYDASGEPLRHAQRRLEALGIDARCDLRDVWEGPDRQVGFVFTGFWLSHVAPRRLGEFLALMYRWLEPGGLYAFIDSRQDPESGAIDHAGPEDEIQVRRIEDGSTYRVRKIYYTPQEIRSALSGAGFRDVEVLTTDRFFLLGSARR